MVPPASAVQNYLCASKGHKGQALVDFLADHPVPADWDLSEDFLDENILFTDILPPWKMYFDGSANRDAAGAGIVFVTPEGEVLPYSFTLKENCSNNVAEYQALIIGLEMALDNKHRHLKGYGDSKLVVSQILWEYEVKKDELHLYSQYARKIMAWLGDVSIEHVPRKDNKQADALVKLASALTFPDKEVRMPLCKEWAIPPKFEDDDNLKDNAVEVFDIEEDEDWRQLIVDYLKYQTLPNDLRRRTDIQR